MPHDNQHSDPERSTTTALQAEHAEHVVPLPSSAPSYYYPTGEPIRPSSAPSPAVPVPDMSNPHQLSHFERWAVRASDSQFNALSGAIGGFTSGIVTCPLDVIKTKLQAQGGFAAIQKGRHVGHHKVYEGLVGTGRVIWREEGLRGMYRGLGPIILGYLPTWAVWFTVYNKSKVVLAQHHGRHPPC